MCDTTLFDEHNKLFVKKYDIIYNIFYLFSINFFKYMLNL